ncbi:PilZ domain-containing protein [Saliniramus fredricksonii]|nr:PilZ domain-containing protein [Saliniramus fredricksonii]
MDISVRQRLARFRRDFMTLDWVGRSRADGGPASADFILDDTLAAYGAIGHGGGVDWQDGRAAYHDAEIDPGYDLAPAPEAVAAIDRLAESVGAEAAALGEIASRAERDGRGIAAAQVRAASRALSLIADNQCAADPEAASAFDPAIWLAVFSQIQDIVAAIGETALESGLCAVRAASATRGFFDFAREIDELERALRAGWPEIERLAGLIEEAGAQAGALSAELRMTRRALDAAVTEFASDTLPPAEIEPLIRHRLARIGTAAAQATGMARRIAAEARASRELIETLVEQFMVMIRETPLGDRRAAPRLAFFSHCTLATATRQYAARTIDISMTGALVALDMPDGFRRGQPVRLTLPDAPPLMGTVAGISQYGLHIAFDLGHAVNAPARAPLRRMLSAVQHHDDGLVSRVHAFAREIRTALERAVAEGSCAHADLIAPQLDPPREREDVTYGHPCADLFEAHLAAFVAGLLQRNPDIAHVAAMDRGGYVAAGAGSAPARGVLPPWRPGQLRQDRESRRHARNLRPSVAHNLRDDAGLVRVISAPIFLGGRHWGCAEIGFRLPEIGESADSPENGVLFEQDQGADLASG